MKNKIKNTVYFVILLLISIIIIGSIYYYTTYPKQDFDVVMFTMTAGVENTSPDVVKGIISSCIIPLIAILMCLSLPLIRKTKSNLYINLKIRKKAFTFQIFPIKFFAKHRVIREFT